MVAAAMVGAAVVGAGASAVASNEQSDAANDAARLQQEGASNSLAFQQMARNEAKDVLTPYVDAGNQANDLIYSFLGMPQNRSDGQATLQSQINNFQTSQDFGAYVDNNPDLLKAYQDGSWASGQGMSKEDFGREHWERHGSREQRGYTPTTASEQELSALRSGLVDTPGQTPTDIQGAQDNAWAVYETTPWAKQAEVAADDAQDTFLSRAGASGSALSGRTAKGLREESEKAKLSNFNSYLGQLSGVAGTGFQAASGIASGGQTFANNAGQITMAAADAGARAEQASGDATANAISDGAAWAGWAAGNLGNSKNGNWWSNGT